MRALRWSFLLCVGCGPLPYANTLHDRLNAGDADGARKVLDDALADPKLAADRRGLALLERASLRVERDPAKAVLADLVEGDRLLETADLDSAVSSSKKKTPRGMLRYQRNGAIRFLGKPVVLKPHERLYENVLGMAAAFAAGERNAMRVEARRLTLTRKDLHSYAISSRAYDLIGIGGLLASSAFESQDRREACAFATEAARISKASVVSAQVDATCTERVRVAPGADSEQPTATAKVRGVVIAGLAPRVALQAVNGCFGLFERPAPPTPEVSVDGVRVNVELLVDFVPIAFDFWERTVGAAPVCGTSMGLGQDSWQTLPGRLFAFSRALEPGAHTVQVKVGGRERTHNIVVEGGDIGLMDSFLFEGRDDAAPLRSLIATPPKTP